MEKIHENYADFMKYQFPKNVATKRVIFLVYLWTPLNYVYYLVLNMYVFVVYCSLLPSLHPKRHTLVYRVVRRVLEEFKPVLSCPVFPTAAAITAAARRNSCRQQ